MAENLGVSFVALFLPTSFYARLHFAKNLLKVKSTKEGLEFVGKQWMCFFLVTKMYISTFKVGSIVDTT